MAHQSCYDSEAVLFFSWTMDSNALGSVWLKLLAKKWGWRPERAPSRTVHYFAYKFTRCTIDNVTTYFSFLVKLIKKNYSNLLHVGFLWQTSGTCFCSQGILSFFFWYGRISYEWIEENDYMLQYIFGWFVLLNALACRCRVTTCCNDILVCRCGAKI